MRSSIRMAAWLTTAIVSLPGMSMEHSEVRHLVESSGFIYPLKGGGVKRLDAASFVLVVHIDAREGKTSRKSKPTLRERRSVVVHVDRDSVTPVDSPVWPGGSVSIDVLDINGDQEPDFVVSEYYEPEFTVRVFFREGGQGFKKVLDSHSIISPKVVDIARFGRSGNRVKEVILYEDPIGLGGHRDTVIPYLYVLRGDEYELIENNCSRTR